jgi:hypothetical protein
MPDVLNVVSRPLRQKGKPKAFARANVNVSLDQLLARGIFLLGCDKARYMLLYGN